MAALQIQALGTCAGGEHVTVRTRLDGSDVQTVIYPVADMTRALVNEDVAAVILTVIRLHARGKTTTQLRTDLTAGLSLTI